MKTTLSLIAILAILTAADVQAATGDLDVRFGAGGFARLAAARSDSVAPSRPAVQADGRIVICETHVVDHTLYEGWVPADIVVTRLMPDGARDETFGNGGSAVVGDDDGEEVCSDVAIQGDGKIVVTGWHSDASTQRPAFLVARLNTDGALDSTFAESGISSPVWGGGPEERAFGRRVVISSDGRIIVAGTVQLTASTSAFGFLRVHPDGTSDTTFGAAGKALLGFHDSRYGDEFAQLIALTSDTSGRLLAEGIASKGPHEVIKVVRLTPDGFPDDAFAAHGAAELVFDESIGTMDWPSDIATQPDGRVVVVGTTSGGSAYSARSSRMAVARLLGDGQPDLEFGSRGIAIAAFDPLGDADSAGGVIVASDGTLIVGGSSGLRAAAIRFTHDGRLDVSFGNSGKVEYTLPLIADEAWIDHLVATGTSLHASGELNLVTPESGAFLLRSFASFAARFDGEPTRGHSAHARPVRP